MEIKGDFHTMLFKVNNIPITDITNTEVRPKLPADLYCPGYMTPAERNEFFDWYNQLPSDYVFDFNEELLAYCEQDVTSLFEVQKNYYIFRG